MSSAPTARVGNTVAVEAGTDAGEDAGTDAVVPDGEARPGPEQAGRIAAPGGVALFLGVGLVMTVQTSWTDVAVVVLAVACAAALSLRSVTGWAVLPGLAPAILAANVLGFGQSANLGWMTLCVVAGWVALTAPLAAGIVVAGASVAVVGFQAALDPAEPGWFAWSTGVVFTLVACSFAVRLRETNRALQAAQAELAERSRTEERARIAAEVHDVIGHALTVSILHIESARLGLDDDPGAARAGLEQAEALTRRSLEEVRATVTGLRPGGRDAPLPGADDLRGDLTALAASFDDAGASVRLRVDDPVGALAALGPTRGLAVYRIVQEALTNAARHAPGEIADVRVEATGAEILVTAANPARAVAPARPGSGIRGMQERATAVGGTLVARSTAAGWIVEGRLPA